MGPLLFLIYINDLCNAISHSQTSLFADDTSIIYDDYQLETIERKLNLDLNNLFKWLCANKISLNVAKTKVLLFRNPHKKVTYNLNLFIDNSPLKLSDSVKYLGVTLDHFLNWNLNTKNLCSKLTKANGAISKLRHFVPMSTLIQIYYALFFSHLNYSCQIWGQTLNHNVERVFILQKQCLRLMTFSNFDAPSSEIFSNLNLLKVHDLIKLCNVILVHQILNSECPSRVNSLFSLNFYQHNHNTRGNLINLLSRPSVRTFMYGTNSITYCSIVQRNNLQELFPQTPLTDFSKAKLNHIYQNSLASDY